MKSILLFLIMAIFFTDVFSQDVSMVKGKFNGIEFSKVSLQSHESPLTGAEDRFEAVLLDSGKFQLQAELYVPKIFDVLVDDRHVAQILLCPGEDLIINLDTDGFEFEGVTKDFNEWRRAIRDDYLKKYSIAYAKSKGIDIDDTKNLSTYLFDQVKENISSLDKLKDRFSLNACEYDYSKSRVKYALYTFLWSEFNQKGYSIEGDAYQFMNELPLDDVEAAKISLDYNRAINIYIFLQLRLEKGWHESNSFNFSSDTFNNLYYEKILTEIRNEEVKNITLTRKVINLLSAGSTSGESLFKRYLNDCSDSAYKEIAFRYYNDFLKTKNHSKQNLKIGELSGSLVEEIEQHKGKVLYIDFWASWCKPCIESLPFTKKLQEKYQGQPFEIIYVSIDDNIGSSETAAKKLNLQGSIIYLDKEQSAEIKDMLKIQGIPHYTLVDKEGVIVAPKAPPPKSKAIEEKISELLK